MASERRAAAVPPQPWLMTIAGSLSRAGAFGAKISAAMRVPSLRMSAVRKVTSSGTLNSGFLSCADAPEATSESVNTAHANSRVGDMATPRESGRTKRGRISFLGLKGSPPDGMNRPWGREGPRPDLLGFETTDKLRPERDRACREPGHVAVRRSVRLGRDQFTSVRSRDGIPCPIVHRALDETDRAVHEQHVHAARVVGTGRNHGDGPAAILVDVVVHAACAIGRLGVRVDHGGAITPPLTLPLPLLVGAGDRHRIAELCELKVGREEV